MQQQVKEGSKDLDLHHWIGRVSMELVGQGILGYSFDPLVTESQDKYAKAFKDLMYVSWRITL